MTGDQEKQEDCPHLFIWCNTATGIYQCGIPEEEGDAMGCGPQEGCGKRWKDVMLREEVSHD